MYPFYMNIHPFQGSQQSVISVRCMELVKGEGNHNFYLESRVCTYQRHLHGLDESVRINENVFYEIS